MPIDNKYGKVTLEKGTIGEDEPVFVFRAQDQLALKVLKVYRMFCQLAGSPDKHQAIIDAAAKRFKVWQTSTGPRSRTRTTTLTVADNLGVNPYVAIPYDPIEASKKAVYSYVVSETIPPTGREDTEFTLDEILVVWFNKSLGNWKALVTTSLPNGLYYEVTHNGETGATYFDVYQKIDHFETMEIGQPTQT